MVNDKTKSASNNPVEHDLNLAQIWDSSMAKAANGTAPGHAEAQRQPENRSWHSAFWVIAS